MLGSIHDKLNFDDVLLLKAMLTDTLCRKSTTKEKNSNKNLVQDLKYRYIGL